MSQKKTFVHICLRDSLKLTCSENVRTDERVTDVYAKIAKLQESGIRLQDKYKQKITDNIHDITKLDITAQRRFLGYEYWELCVWVVLALICDAQKPENGGAVPRTKDYHILVAKVLELHLKNLDEAELRTLFHYGEDYTGMRKDMGVAFVLHFGLVSPRLQINELYNPADNDLIKNIDPNLARLMRVLSTKHCTEKKLVKDSSKAEAEKNEILGIMGVGTYNNELSNRLESGNGEKTIENIAEKQADKAITRNESKKKAAA